MKKLYYNIQHKRITVIISILLFIIAWGSMKISLPALPTLVKTFNTSSNKVMLSVSMFFCAFALSQLFWGAFSDKYGRKPTIVVGILISILGTAIVIFSIGINSYILGRCIEGVGVGVCSPSARAIITDIYNRKKIARFLTISGSVVGLMPAVAPIIGGFILQYFGWRYIFVFMFILILLFLIIIYKKLPETHKDISNDIPLLKRFYTAGNILKSRLFWRYIVCYALVQGSLLGYYGSMPFWYIKQWGIPKQYYSFLALFSVGGYILGLFLVRHMIKKISLEFILKDAIFFILGIAIMSLIFAIIGFSGIFYLVLIMSFFAIASGIIFPTVNALLLDIFKENAGMISAVSTTILFLTAGMLALIESQFNVLNLWNLTVFLIIISAGCLLSNCTFKREYRNF
jgi:MFS transporter, DHA1 family, 2-module integral membrane pump EmrD